MTPFEYKVVPAPTRGIKVKGIKTPEARFAHAIELAMNEMAADGWEYVRADTLPSTQRAGLTGTSTEWRHLLVFRRIAAAVADAPENDAPELLPPPDPEDAEVPADDTPGDVIPGPGATRMLADNGVEDTSEVSGMTNSLKTRASQRDEAKD